VVGCDAIAQSRKGAPRWEEIFLALIVTEPDRSETQIEGAGSEGRLNPSEDLPANDAITVRYPRWARRYVVALGVVDLMASFVAALACWVARPAAGNGVIAVLGWRVGYWMLAVLLPPIWLLALALSGAYRRGHAGERSHDFRLPVVTAVRLAGAASILAFAFRIRLSRLLVVVYFPALIVASLVLRGVVRWGLATVRRRGLALRRTLLVGEAACVAKFADHLLRSPVHDYRLVGACVPERLISLPTQSGGLLVVGTPDDLVAAAERIRADTVAIVGDPQLRTTTMQEIAWRIERSGRDLLVAPDVVDLAGPRIRVGDV
jgi:FlaA1/EpsC-like NDP-sugar epimerase